MNTAKVVYKRHCKPCAVGWGHKERAAELDCWNCGKLGEPGIIPDNVMPYEQSSDEPPKTQIDTWLQTIDDELDLNRANRDAHLTDPTIDGMIAVGKLPEESRDYFKNRKV